MEPFDASRFFLTVMSWYSVLSADCQNVLTVEYCVPKGVLYIAYVQKLLLAIIGLPKEVIFLCVWHVTCKMLLYTYYDWPYCIESYSCYMEPRTPILPSMFHSITEESLPAISAPSLLSVFLPSPTCQPLPPPI